MNKLLRSMRKYPIVVVFFVFLAGFSMLDASWPKRTSSALENRKLAQYPTIKLADIATNKWMKDYEAYVKDQFAFRDTWIDLKSFSETALLKTENNGILLGKDHYLFKKIFTVDENRVKLNASAIEKFSLRHPEAVDVMIVPSASAVLQDKLPLAVPLVNENAHLDALRDQLSKSSTYYDLRPTLLAHGGENIFYRTDHHWTTDGAFLAYEEYALSKGFALFDKNSAPAKTVSNFYGTHYSSARNMGVVPDTILYYDVPNLMTITTDTGVSAPDSLYDTSKFETRDKYAAFLRGNNSYSEIQGNGAGKLLVVKDSYANSFVPFLTANYETIGVVDFRNNPSSLEQIFTQGGFDRVLFLYSFDSFCNDTFFAAKVAVA